MKVTSALEGLTLMLLVANLAIKNIMQKTWGFHLV